MRYGVTVISPRHGDGITPETCFRPTLVDDYQLDHWSDITGQIAIHDPNIMILFCVVDDVVLSNIEYDQDYLVISSEVLP